VVGFSEGSCRCCFLTSTTRSLTGLLRSASELTLWEGPGEIEWRISQTGMDSKVGGNSRVWSLPGSG
jgi:hypothetical protein